MQLRAFTLFEVIVAMLVSSIVIASGYMAVEIATKQFAMMQTDRQESLDALFFHAALVRDVSSCKKMMRANSGWVCQWYDGTEVLYTIRKDSLTRLSRTSKETLTYPIQGFDTYFEEQQIARQTDIVDRIVLKVGLASGTEQMQIYKTYATDTKLEALRGNGRRPITDL